MKSDLLKKLCFWNWRWRRLWQLDGELDKENDFLFTELAKMTLLVKNLAGTIEYEVEDKLAIKADSIHLLAAIALQFGGKVNIKEDFVKIAGDQYIDIQRLDSGAVSITCVDGEPEEPFVDDEE